eukprot:COSAG03_NODE_860_length_5596_cov_16.024195_2_plen_69_part_00
MALLVAPSLKAPTGSRGTAVRIILRLAAVHPCVVRVASAGGSSRRQTSHAGQSTSSYRDTSTWYSRSE